MTRISLLARFVPLVLALLTLHGNPSVQAESSQVDALVYCPVGMDAAGCERIVSVLNADGAFSAVVRAYDGSDGTLDLAGVDLRDC